MDNKVINFDTGKVASNIIYDIVKSIKHWEKTKLNRNLSIYGYEDDQFNITDVEKALKLLKQFKYIDGYKDINDDRFILLGHEVKMDLSKEITEYNNAEPRYFRRKPKFFIFINEKRWEYLDEISYRGLEENKEFFIGKENQRIIKYALKRIECNISIFDDIITSVDDIDKKYVDNIKKIEKEDKLPYVEDILYFLVDKYPELIEFIRKDILRGGVIRSVSFDEKFKNIYGYRGKHNELIYTLKDMERKFIKCINGGVAVDKQYIINQLWKGKELKKQNSSFKALKGKINKIFKEKGIDHVMKIKHNSGLYILEMNKNEGN